MKIYKTYLSCCKKYKNLIAIDTVDCEIPPSIEFVGYRLSEDSFVFGKSLWCNIQHIKDCPNAKYLYVNVSNGVFHSDKKFDVICIKISPDIDISKNCDILLYKIGEPNKYVKSILFEDFTTEYYYKYEIHIYDVFYLDKKEVFRIKYI